MKFTIAVVVLVLVASAQSSLLPLSPWASPIVASPWAAPAAHSLVTSSQYIAAPAPLVHAAPYVHAPVIASVPVGATYVAANRGSVHTAPLPGHLESAASINLLPAPGTY